MWSRYLKCASVYLFHVDINECQSAPCLNGGTCNDELDSYTCTCDVGYTGLHCEISMFHNIHKIFLSINKRFSASVTPKKKVS